MQIFCCVTTSAEPARVGVFAPGGAVAGVAHQATQVGLSEIPASVRERTGVSNRVLAFPSLLLVAACSIVVALPGCGRSDSDRVDDPNAGVESGGIDTQLPGESGSGGDSAGQDSAGSGSDGDSGTATNNETGNSGTTPESSTSDGQSTGDGSDGSSDATDSTNDATGDGTAACGGTVYQCGDGIDNDGDGVIDGADPECIGVCDNDEGSFATGIPGDNKDCKQDCFFDGDSGSGNDGCIWDIRCDPQNPGEGSKCEFQPEKQCKNDGPSQQCLDFCLPNVPNGCDCFGCCTVYTPNGSVDVFLGSGGDCSVDNLDACNSCTKNYDCENPCEPEKCEICIGDVVYPVDCEENEDDDDPDTERCPEDLLECEEQNDCPMYTYCFQGCCHPTPG